MTLLEIIQRQLELREQFKSANPHTDGFFRSPVTAGSADEHPLRRAANEMNAGVADLPDAPDQAVEVDDEQLLAHAL